MAERGRPTDYKPEYAETVFGYCLLGCSNEDLARIYEVDISTLERWIAKHDAFRGAILEGRDEADARVAKSLYKKAMGYTDKDGKEIPPDSRAAEFWLKNRQRSKWRERQEVEITTDDATLEARLLAARKRVQDDKVKR
jgi:hypothetical protein